MNETIPLDLLPDNDMVVNVPAIVSDTHVAQDFKKKITNVTALYSGLKYLSLADKAGNAQIETAHKEAKSIITAIEKNRVAEKAEYIAKGKKVDADAEAMTLLLEPLVDYLAIERKKFTDEENRVKKEKQDAIDTKNRGRCDALTAIGAQFDYTQIVTMSDAHYAAHLQVETTASEQRKRDADELERLRAEEAQRVAQVEAARVEAQRVEAERLEAQRVAQAAQQAVIDAALAKIAAAEQKVRDDEAKVAAEKLAQDQAEIKRVADAVAEENRKIRDAQIAKAAAEKALADKAEAEKRAEAQRVADEKAKAEKAAEIEAAKPDVEKLKDFADFVRKISIPALTTEKGENVIRLLRVNLDNLVTLIKSEAESLIR